MVQLVRKSYYCPLCNTKHYVELPADFAEDRPAYPFVHTYMHTFSSTKPHHDTGKDIITMLYIDKNLEIRHAEAMFQNAEGNIVSMEDANKMIGFLTTQLQDLQDSFDALFLKYQNLEKEYLALKEKNP